MFQIISPGDEDSPFGFGDLAALCGAMLQRDVNCASSNCEGWVLDVAAHLQEADQILFLQDGTGILELERVSDNHGVTVQRLVVFSFQSLIPNHGEEFDLFEELWTSLEDNWEWGHGLDENPATRAFLSSLVSAVACAVVEYLSSVGEIKVDIVDCPPRYGSGMEPPKTDPEDYDGQAARHLLNGQCIEAVSTKASAIARNALVRFVSDLKVVHQTN